MSVSSGHWVIELRAGNCPKQHFWDEVKWEFASWMTSWQVCSNCLMLLCQCGPKSAPCWIYAKKNRDGSEAKRPSTLKLYLIKRSVSVWTDQIFFSSTTCLSLFIFLSNIWQQTTLLTICFFNQIIKYFFMFRQHYHVCLNCAHTTCFGYMEPGCFVWAV